MAITHWNLGLGSFSSRVYPQVMCQPTGIPEHRQGGAALLGMLQETQGAATHRCVSNGAATVC